MQNHFLDAPEARVEHVGGKKNNSKKPTRGTCIDIPSSIRQYAIMRSSLRLHALSFRLDDFLRAKNFTLKMGPSLKSAVRYDAQIYYCARLLRRFVYVLC